MRMPKWRFTTRGALVAGALLCLIAAGARLLLPDPPPPPLIEGERLRVPAQAISVTQVGYFHKTPPPWKVGNCFGLSHVPIEAGQFGVRGQHVANMHFENFEEAVKRLGLKAVDVQYIGGYFFVVDPRIPRQWLLEQPCSSCTRSPGGESILAKHADKFREPDAQSKDADKFGGVRDDQY
jgi:hypothetical protein